MNVAENPTLARSLLSLAVICAFAVSLAATSKPRGDREPLPPTPDSASTAAATEAVAPDTVFAAVQAATRAISPGTACTDALLDAARKDVRVRAAQSGEGVDVHSIPLVNGSTGLLFTRANAQKDNADDPWRFLNAPLVNTLNPLHYSVVEHAESSVQQNARSLQLHGVFAVVMFGKHALPKTTGEAKLTGGFLDGELVFARTDNGAHVCHVWFEAASSKARMDDFREQVRATMNAALKKTAPSYSVDGSR